MKPEFNAITLNDLVIMRDEIFQILENWNKNVGETLNLDEQEALGLIIHELVHVRQYRNMGEEVFINRYLTEAIVNGYTDISMEEEAKQYQDWAVSVISSDNGHICTSNWTDWFDRDNPSDNGDGEWIEAFEQDGTVICPATHSITGIESRRISDELTANLTGEIFTAYDSEVGFACENKDQLDNKCFDYEVRFVCSPSNDDLLITLIDFTVTPTKNRIHIQWKTASEIDNAGFSVFRATGEDWKYGDYSQVKRLTSKLIPIKGNKTNGHSYHYVDSNVEPGVTYYYGLEDISTDGKKTVHVDFTKAIAE